MGKFKNLKRSIIMFTFALGVTIPLCGCFRNENILEEEKEEDKPVLTKRLTDLTMSGSLEKTKYFVGDTFDPSGLKFTATFSDGNSFEVTSQMTYDVTTFYSTATTSVLATFTYGNDSKTMSVSGFTVEQPKIVSLIYEGELNKKVYFEGNTLDLSGLTFYSVMNNGKRNDVTGYVKLEKETLDYGDTSAVVYYKFGTTKYTVTVTGFETYSSTMILDSLSYTGSLSKTEYSAGESLDLTRFKFIAHFTSGVNVDVTSDVTFDKTVLSAGDISVTASYKFGLNTKSCIIDGFTTYASNVTLTSLSIQGSLLNTIFDEGDPIDITGLTFIAHFSDSQTKDVTKHIVLDKTILELGDTSVNASYTFKNSTKSAVITGFTVVDPSVGKLRHYSAAYPTINEPGCKEFWVTEDNEVTMVNPQKTCIEKGPLKRASINLLTEDDLRYVKPYKEIISFEDGLVPNSTLFSNVKSYPNTLSITSEIATEGINSLKIVSNIAESSLKVSKEYLDAVFADNSVTAIEFNAKSNALNSNFRHSGNIDGEMKNVCYEVNNNGFGLDTTWKTFRFERSFYDFFVEKNDYAGFITIGNFTVGNYVFVDNIHPVHTPSKDLEAYSFENGGIFNSSGHYITNPTENKLVLNGSTGFDSIEANDDKAFVTDGLRSIKLTRTSNSEQTALFVNQEAVNSMRPDDALEIDFYPHSESTFYLNHTIGAVKFGNNDYYVQTIEGNKWYKLEIPRSKMTDDGRIFITSGSQSLGEYYFDNIRIRRNNVDGLNFNSGFITNSGNKELSYKMVKDGPVLFKVTSSSAILTNQKLEKAPSKLQDYGKSFKFTKAEPGHNEFYLGDEIMQNVGVKGISFDLYTTVGINSRSGVLNLLDGKGNIINPNGYQHKQNVWKTYTFSKDRIEDSGLFLQTNGSSQGDYYIDNIKILTEDDTLVNAGTFFLGMEDNIVIDTKEDLSSVTQFFVDDVHLNTSEYEIDNSKISFSNKQFGNGEHKLSYNLKVSDYGVLTRKIYFGCYKASSKLDRECTITYGSQGYQSFNNLQNINRVVFNGKPIAYEKNGINFLIPEAAIIECLNEENGEKVSGDVKLIIVSEEMNAKVTELDVHVTLEGDSEVLSTREYETDENYHAFGYSSTGGGKLYDELFSDDEMMDYSRSGLDEIYEQIGGIQGEINADSFKLGGSLEYIGKDFEQADRMGKKTIVIDYGLRSHIVYDKVQVFNSSGTLLGTVTYSPTIDDNTTSKNNFKTEAAKQLGISSSSISSWKRYQKPVYGAGGDYADFETYVSYLVNRFQYYVHHESLSKIVICDEPRYYNLEAVGQLYKAGKEALKRCGREDVEIDANLLPLLAGWGYADGDGLGPLPSPKPANNDNKPYPTRIAIYDAYLTKFLNETGADYISYDIYPLWDGSTSSSDGFNNSVDECAYSNLIEAAKFAKANNVELRVVTEAYTAVTRNSKQNRRVMSADDMRWLCNQLMGFGVSRVSFFTYYNRSLTSSEFRYDDDPNSTVGSMKIEHVDENGNVDAINRTDCYYSIQGELDEMNEFKNVALNFSYVDCNMISGSTIKYRQEKNSTSSSYQYPIKWAEQLDTDTFNYEISSISVDAEYCLTSTLVDSDGNYMYMIQNACDPKYSSLQEDTITFKDGSYVVIYENGTKRIVKLTGDKKLTLKLSSGHAAFIMVY